MRYKVIITGSNGLVGEGVLQECIKNQFIEEILVVSRWGNGIQHPKVKELIIPDFLDLDEFEDELTGYDACFYCSNVKSFCLNEQIYTHITFDITTNFAVKLLMLNPDISFNYLSIATADRSERSRSVRARTYGKTENALNKLVFKRIHYFRVGLVKPSNAPKSNRFFYKMIDLTYPLLKIIMPNKVITAEELGLAMINVVLKDYPERTIVTKDIRYLAKLHRSLVLMANKLNISSVFTT